MTGCPSMTVGSTVMGPQGFMGLLYPKCGRGDLQPIRKVGWFKGPPAPANCWLWGLTGSSLRPLDRVEAVDDCQVVAVLVLPMDGVGEPRAGKEGEASRPRIRVIIRPTKTLPPDPGGCSSRLGAGST